ncbi:Rhodocoxin reductase [Defluviimonas aquaemixtae]|uniref:Rhodocoxin reductase n=1 Tax=Albidovulum aquaemixtae TaxID=1542388 RepID=A0A2R8BNP6_9RHOB|nr:FAD-dependent oxidoreductase [Defluviimonas aquaemixtae]SPH25059.1 Rhodocoxin reductase [Defluviimonas aquaemixtae]
MAGIAIIGAGECGIRAAFAARDAGYEGAISVIGDEPVPPYERPPLSKPDETGAIEKPITNPEALAEKAINLQTGISVTQLDRAERKVRLSDGTSMPYEKMLLATGARPRALSCPGGENAKVLRTVADARTTYRAAASGTRVVIVGAGLIGLELAALLSARGAGVTVLEAGPRPLGRNVPRGLVAALANRHREQGVQIICDASVVLCAENTVVLDKERIFEADLIVAAIGVVPSVELAEAAGLSVQNGICVDDSLVTDDPLIYAAGDCASVKTSGGTYRRYETWQNARAQGEMAGRNLAGSDAQFDVPIWFWSDQYDLGRQGVGNTSGDPSAIRALGNQAQILFFLDGQDRLNGAAGLGPGNTVAKDIKIAQRLIGSEINPALLSDPSHNMKKLLRAA